MKLPSTLVIILVYASTAFGQTPSVDSSLSAAEKQYNGGLYESAELTARRVMEQTALSDSLRITGERIIAFCLVAQGKTSLATEHFNSILKLNPSFQLDPVLTSPKILTVFNETKLRFGTTGSSVLHERGTAELMDTGPSFRSVLFPGWEQYYRGRTEIGLSFLGAGALSLGSGIAFELLRSSARKDYLAATQPSSIAAKYSTYNRYYRIEAYSFIAFAAVYVASEMDVYLTRNRSMEIHPAFDPTKGPILAFSFHW
jgi:hypothetical protein